MSHSNNFSARCGAEFILKLLLRPIFQNYLCYGTTRGRGKCFVKRALSLDRTAAPAHPYLPKLLITIFGHTPYLPQGDTMFLGHPTYIVEFPWQNYGYFVYLLRCECKWGGFRRNAFFKVMQMKALCNMETGWRKAENISPVSPFFCAHRIAGFVSTVTQIPLGLSLAILEG